LTICVSKNCSVAHQTSGYYEIAPLVDCRDGVTGGQRHDLARLTVEKRIALDQHRSGMLIDQSCKCAVDVAFSAGVED